MVKTRIPLQSRTQQTAGDLWLGSLRNNNGNDYENVT